MTGGTVGVVRANFDYLNGSLRPTWRGRLHAVAALMFLPASVALLRSTTTTVAVAALAVFSISLIATFSVSATYHIAARTIRSQRVMQRVDHAMIFVLIASTYTAVCLLALPRPAVWWVLGPVWIAALTGAALKLTHRGWRLCTMLYLVVGWSVVGAVPYMWHHSGVLPTALLVLGGVLYTAGAVVFFTGKPKRHATHFGHHEIWHTFTVVASMSHFLAIAALATQSTNP